MVYCWICRKGDPHPGEDLLRPLLASLKRRRAVQDCLRSCQELQSRSDNSGFVSTTSRAGITVRITSTTTAVTDNLAAQGWRAPEYHGGPVVDSSRYKDECIRAWRERDLEAGR